MIFDFLKFNVDFLFTNDAPRYNRFMVFPQFTDKGQGIRKRVLHKLKNVTIY